MFLTFANHSKFGKILLFYTNEIKLLTKGQTNSKGLFGVIVLTKKPTKSFKDFLPWPLKRIPTKKLYYMIMLNRP